MKIIGISVRYGELRSTGYPTFSNTRHEIELQAMLTPGETPETAKNKLLNVAKQAVKQCFDGVTPAEPEMLIPF